MISKKVRNQFKEELSVPGAMTWVEYDPAIHGGRKSFRSTVIYAANSIHMSISTEFVGNRLYCHRVDVPALDATQTVFNGANLPSLDKAAELMGLLRPMPSDPYYELKSGLVDAAIIGVQEWKSSVEKYLREQAHEG